MARVVKCPKCGELGSLQPKKTKHGIYWRVGHYKGLKGNTRKVKWCYIGKQLPESMKKQMITQKETLITQEFTQTNTKSNNLKSSSIHKEKPFLDEEASLNRIVSEHLKNVRFLQLVEKPRWLSW